MITENEARIAAEDLLARNPSAFRYEFMATRMVRGQWSVVFAVFTAEGNELDGPVVVRVDPVSGKTTFLSVE